MNAVTGIGGQLFLIILKFITRTVFIHTLGKAYLGINGLFSDILTMLSLTELGLDTAINFRLYKPLAEKDEQRVRILMKFYRMAYCVVGITILVLGLCVIPFLPKLIHDYDSLEEIGINAVFVFLLYLMQSVSSYLFFASRSAIVRADQKEYILNIANYAVELASSICQIILLVVWQSFIAYTACAVLFNIVKNLVEAAIAKYFYGYAFVKEKEQLSIAEVKDIFKDLGALFVYKVNGVVLTATDNLVLSAFIGLSIVGMYSNYLMFYNTVKALLNNLYSAVKASMGNLFATGSVQQKCDFFEIMNFASALMYGTACVGVAIEADELIICWIGRDYVIPQPFSVLMGIEILFAGLKINLGQIRNVSGAFRQMWFRPILGMLINLVVSIATVQKWGIYGVLIGTITADFTTNFMVDPRIIYKYSLENYKPVAEYYIRNAGYGIVLTVTGILDAFICNNIMMGMGWLSVIVHCMICAVSVPVAFYIVFHNRDECKYLINKLLLLRSQV
jgi:O-antigen/teichoic acid export membrane protein